jgi:hypothetical protein
MKKQWSRLGSMPNLLVLARKASKKDAALGLQAIHGKDISGKKDRLPF